MPITLSQMLEGLDAQVVQQVENTVKANATKLNAKLFIDGDGEHYVPAARLSEVTTERNDLRSTLAEQKKQIDTLATLTKDNEQAQETIATLNSQLDNQSKLTKRAAITAKLATSVTDSVAPASDLLDFLNIEEVSVNEDGSITGLDAQVAKIRESRKYLFNSPATPPADTPPGTGNPGGGSTPPGKKTDPKKVGTLGKLLAEQAVSANKAPESSFWK